VIADVAGGGAQYQALLVGGQRGRGEVRHGGLQAAQIASVGEEVKGIATAKKSGSDPEPRDDEIS
jgi:hypothetical protein